MRVGTYGAVLCIFISAVSASRAEVARFPTLEAQAAGQEIQRPKLLELTRSDVFASKSWSGDRVSVLGFALGMSRSEAFRVAADGGLRLSDSVPRSEEPCRSSLCDVETGRGFYVGVSLQFDTDETVQRIDVSFTPADADPRVKAVAITKKFSGQTYKFFNHYSDKLRINLLGPGVLVKRDTQLPPKVPEMDEIYDYPERGLRIYASVVETSPLTPVDIDLTVSFTRP